MKRLIFAAALLALASPALAVDLDHPILSFDGKDFTDPKGEPIKMVLRTVIENSLLSNFPEDQQNQEGKNKRFWLAVKVHEAPKDWTPSPDEIVAIKAAIAKAQPTAVMGQATRLIDPTWLPK